MDCPVTTWSACPTPPAENPAIASAPPSAAPVSAGRTAVSPSTSLRRRNARPAPGSTWRSPSGCSSPPSSCPATWSTGTPSSASSGSTARSGVFPASHRWSMRSTTVPSWFRSGNVVEAQIAARGPVLAAADLATAVGLLCRGRRTWDPLDPVDSAGEPPPLPDLSDVRGQPVARRALEIAAAGGHHLLLVGSPGSGKTMLAQRLAGLLPPLDRDQALETTMVHSAAGLRLPPGGLVRQPPFRAPHHTTSVVGLVGGGSHQLRPGEVSLANNGVLFMDELGEFGRAALEGLREPLEEGVIRVARGRDSRRDAGPLPARCGDQPVPVRRRSAGSLRVRRRRPPSVPPPAVGADHRPLRPAGRRPPPRRRRAARHRRRASRRRVVRQRVVAARAVALSRAGKLNAALAPDELDTLAPLSEPARALLRERSRRDRLTGRGYHRVRRVAANDRRPRRSAATSRSRSPTVELALQMRAPLRQRSVGPTADRWIA